MPGPVYADFFSPFMAATIVTRDGTRWPMWTTGPNGASLNVPRVQGDPLHALSFLSELTVELQLGMIPKITATLTPPYRDAIALLETDLVEFGNSLIEVILGYTGRTADGSAALSPTFTGITLRPDVTIGTDTSITFHGLGVGWAAQHQGSNQTYHNMSRLEVIQQIAQRHGLTVDSSDVSKDPDANKAMTSGSGLTYRAGTSQQITSDFSQGSRTDWQMIYYLCCDAGCWMVTTQDTLKISPRNALISAQPQYLLSLYDYQSGLLGIPAGGGPAIYPIMSASSPSGAVFLPGVNGLILQDISSSKRQPIQQLIDDAAAQFDRTDTKKQGQNTRDPQKVDPKYWPGTSQDYSKSAGLRYLPGTSKISADSSVVSPPTGVELWSGTPEYQQAIDAAKGVFGQMQTAMGIPLDIDTLLIPDISPGATIKVTGLSLRFDHIYGVFKVTHTVGASGSQTSLHLVSNTAEMITQAFVTDASGSGNTQDVSPDNNSVNKEPNANQGTAG